MNTKRTGAILLSALLLVSAVAPAAVTAQTDESLSLGVTQDETGSVTISVTDNGTAVENATVNVTADGNGTYAGAGEYVTGANGTVSLQTPAEPVTVTVEASYNGTTTTTTVDLEPTLGVEVDGAADGSVVVTVTRGNATVENATVNVTANTTYADTGEFETDANGTVTLANPDETVELTITAMDGNETAATSVVVKPVQTLAVGVEQADDGTVTVSVGRLGEPVANATVDVTATGNDTYAATGEYETDQTGTVVLPAPSENVTVTVTATKDGDTATTTAELEPPEPVGPFGQIVSAFVDALKGAGFTGIGSQVSDFVTSNNPSNAGNSEAVGNDAPVTPAVGNNAPITPPGQEKKDDNESRVVPDGPPVDNPGQSNESNPGNSGSAPGQSGDEDGSPGNSGSAPGQSGDADDDEEDGADDSPGNSGSAPGQSGGADDDEEDEEDDSPGNSGSASGQSDGTDGDEEDEADEEDGSSDDSDSDSDSDDSGEDDDAGSSGNGNSNAGGNGGGGNAGGNGGNGNAGGNGGNGNAGGNGGNGNAGGNGR